MSWRSSDWPHRGESTGASFNPRTEAVRTQRFLLLQVTTDITDKLVGQCVRKRSTVRQRTERRLGTEREVLGMWCQQRIQETLGIGAIARPRMLPPVRPPSMREPG